MQRLILTAVMLATTADGAGATPPLCITEKPNGFAITAGDQPVLFYQRTTTSLDGTYSRANYIHPLYDLDGSVLSEDFPDDHKHHRGIFWAWHQLWVGDKKVGDPWACQDAAWDVRSVRILPIVDSSIAFTTRVDWKSPLLTDEDGNQTPIVHERTTVRVHPATGNHRAIDFTIRLKAALDDVKIGGSEDSKGYGGFSVRVRQPKEMRFRTGGREVEPMRDAIPGGPWVDIDGKFHETDKPSGVTILCHPDSPGYPQPWILRRGRSMQNPQWPGRHSVALSRTEPTVLRYRLILHRGAADAATIDRWQADYAAVR